MGRREQLNESIESFIIRKAHDYVYSIADLNFLYKYDKCEDADLNEAVVFKKVWEIATKMDEGIKAENRFNGDVLITHGGSGKAITSAPRGVSFHIMNHDYFCHEITKALTSGRQKDNFLRYDFGSIAEYFYLGNTNGIPSYDLVISHPPEKCRFAEFDYDELLAKYGEKDARVYYAVRSFAFVKQGGVLLVIVPRKDYIPIHERITELLFHIEGANFDFEVPKITGDDYILKYTRV
jgi:hypothetical protein